MATDIITCKTGVMCINHFLEEILEGENLYYFIEYSKFVEIKIVYAFEQMSH